MSLEVGYISKSEVSPGVFTFRFSRPAGFSFVAGQFFKLTLGDASKYFSFSSPVTDNGFLEFTTRMSGSDFKKRLDGLRTGNNVLFDGPMGSLKYSSSDGGAVFLAGGIGITPFFSILSTLRSLGEKIDVVLVYGSRSYEDIIFRQELEAIEGSGVGLRVVHVLSNPSGGDVGCRGGFITAGLLSEEISDYSERKFYVCGPPKMVESMRVVLSELGVSVDEVVFESFTGY